MKKLIYFFVILFLFYAQSAIGQTKIQGLINHGLSKAYNMELDSAEKIFNRVLEIRPQLPHGYYYLAKLHFWTYLGTRDPGEYLVFLKYADLAQEKIDMLLSTDKSDPTISYMAGNIASYKAMAHATNNSSVDAFWASKKAVKYFEQTLETNSKFYDAYLGLGLFDYAMSFVPDFLKWAVNLTGLSSDKARGLRYVRTAYLKGNFDKTESAFHLAKIYSDYLANYDSAFFFIKSLIGQYPQNVLFHYQYAVTLVRDKKLDKANEELNTVIRINNKKLPQITSLAYYRKGEIAFKKNQYKNAIKNYEKFLDSSKELDLTGIAELNTALSYKFLGNDEEYKKNLALAMGGNQDIFEDSFAKEMSEKFLAIDILPIDLKLIKIKNDIEAGKYKTSYDTLKALLGDLNNDHKALALAYFCDAAIHLDKFAEAVNAVEELKSLNIQNEKWVIPFSYLIASKVNYLVGEKEEANDLLEKAEENNNYGFKDHIQAQIENLKRRISSK